MHLGQRLAAGLACFVFSASFANAAVMLSAELTVDQEVGSNTPANPALLPFRVGPGGLPDENAPRPLSFGTASFVLNDAMTALTMTVTVNNIDVTGTQTPGTFDNLVAAHIHAPAAPGTPTGVVWGFFGNPFHDINQGSGALTPFATGAGGVFQLTWDLGEGAGTGLAGQIGNLLAGLAYINFHTLQFPGGEIRGQIVKVPEAETLAFLGIGLLGLGVVIWRSGRR